MNYYKYLIIFKQNKVKNYLETLQLNSNSKIIIVVALIGPINLCQSETRLGMTIQEERINILKAKLRGIQGNFCKIILGNDKAPST